MRILGLTERQSVLVGDVAYFRFIIESRNDSDLLSLFMQD
jgi:hypothetical protein